jgi:hypothetical protein
MLLNFLKIKGSTKTQSQKHFAITKKMHFSFNRRPVTQMTRDK